MIPATRDEALQALEAFANAPARRYAGVRNHILPDHSNVSRLSAAISHRLITEAEVLTAVLKNHRPSSVEKFLQEVLWRSYWKGWLEMRPGVWRDFADSPEEASPLAERLRTHASGCEAMDACARELVTTGYMHNHARMWWASFWIHRNQLLWKSGARFFLDHLLDADAASNTLSWRWVAGLQTSGKTYLVRRSNLESYWSDAPSRGLEALEGEPLMAVPQDFADRTRVPWEDLPENPVEEPAGLLVHEEDFSVEHGPIGHMKPVAAILWRTQPRSEVRAAWLERAVADACNRSEAAFQKPVPIAWTLPDLKAWVAAHSLGRIVMAAPFVGPVRDSLQPFLDWCQAQEIQVVRVRRPWDSKVLPFAKAGFFPFWNAIRPNLADLTE